MMTSTKNGRGPQKKSEDDLKKNGRRPKKRMEDDLKKMVEVAINQNQPNWL
jgi:hypothetical protein